MSGFLLLTVIYIAFISLGLPDALLGVGWPSMRLEFDAPLAMAGWIFMTIAAGTIISSLFSGKLLERFDTKQVTFGSGVLTALCLFGFSTAPSLPWLFALSIPLGLGAGAVDAALNHYVAEHYAAHHMNWLHCFWGVGATGGPLIMASLLDENGWRDGYLVVALIQFGLAFLLLLSFPLWRQEVKRDKSNHQDEAAVTKLDHTLPRGLSYALVTFLLYCGVEALVGLWASSYLVQMKQFSIATAATWVSIYYGSITAGRLLSGFLSFRFTNRQMIRLGQCLALIGSLVFFLPLNGAMIVGLILVGLGLAPIYPSMLHETPVRFGRQRAKHLMGYQMAFAYIGSTFLPPLFGLIATKLSLGIFPIVLLFIMLFMLLNTERLNRILAKHKEETV